MDNNHIQIVIFLPSTNLIFIEITSKQNILDL